ncbi:phage portal protein [Blastochloris tepida]|uniref:Portal protein n=1 Tax=Blastochloris tepida TaxID=2233851 RepID=A0A348G1D6_9HYPH|nr:phage portal protein [Blastochloris tepida]BBF93369.1 portal protein [Blastochloris tepida]
MNWLKFRSASDEPRRGVTPDGDRGWTPSAGGPLAISGVVVTSERVLQLGSVQAVLNGLAGTISSLPWMLIRRGGDDSRAPARDHPLFRLLHNRPNRRQTSAEFRDELVRHLAFWRNAYARIIPGDDYAIGGLELIHPDRIARIERDVTGRVHYTVNGLGTAPQERLRDDQIWHIRRAPLTVDGLRGQTMVETARQVFGRALAVTDYGDLFFANSGQTGGVLKHPGTFKSKEDRDQFLDNWRLSSTGLNRHRDRLLTHGVEYQQLKITNAEAQLLETEKAADVSVFGLWNYPPHLAARLDRATFSNIEHQSIDFVVHTIGPLITAIEQSATTDLVVQRAEDSGAELVAEFNIAGLLRGDVLARYRAYAIGRQWGWLSVNDIRRLENQNPIEGGDEYLRPLNMVPAGSPDYDPSKPDKSDTPDGDPGSAPAR